MKTQSAQLAVRLQEEGWRIVERDPGFSWWAHEVWKVESEWRPVGKTLWITFLVDRSSDSGHPTDDHVWAVGATATHPKSPLDVNPWAEPIRNGWSASLERLCGRLRELRDEQAGSGLPTVPDDLSRAPHGREILANLKTTHRYHDAQIKSVQFETAADAASDQNMVLEVQLGRYSDLPGATVHIMFADVRNQTAVLNALALVRRDRAPAASDIGIVGLCRDASGRFVVDVDGGELVVDARSFIET